MGEKTMAQHPSRSRRLIEVLVLVVIIVGILLVVAELIMNVLPELEGKPSVSQANQAQATKPVDQNPTGSAPAETREANEAR